MNPSSIVALKTRRLFVLLVLALAPGCAIISGAQIIDNRMGNAFGEEMYFNQEFLWQNKIRSISGIISVKRPGRPIQKLPDMFVFHFNEVGLLREMDKVTSVLHLVDSMRVEYKRNDLGEVELRREKNARGILTTTLNYDELGRVRRIDFGKSENLTEQPGKMEPGRMIIVNSESYEYLPAGDNRTRRKAFNNYGLYYSDKLVERDPLGYIVRETEELVMSGRTITRTYSYNDKGWIDEISQSDNQGSKTKSSLFYYDPFGNLHKVEYFEEKELVREIEVLYLENMLLEALVDHDLQSRDILITKFSYEFFP